MYLFTGDGVDLDQLRERLRGMTDELLRFGKAARNLRSPESNMGKPPRTAFVIQLEEARAEWKRRVSTNVTENFGGARYTPASTTKPVRVEPTQNRYFSAAD
jgi:hypothetical protein